MIKQKTEDYKKVCRKVFNIFAIEIRLNNMNDIMFLYKWWVRLIKHGLLIKLSTNLVKMFKADYNLIVLAIQK